MEGYGGTGGVKGLRFLALQPGSSMGGWGPAILCGVLEWGTKGIQNSNSLWGIVLGSMLKFLYCSFIQIKSY